MRKIPQIDNYELVDRLNNSLKVGLKDNVDYQCVNLLTWLFLRKMYGGGPELSRFDYVIPTVGSTK